MPLDWIYRFKCSIIRRPKRGIHVLSIVDDGCGMTHLDIEIMLSFGYKHPDKENMDIIGRFGVGFKIGSM